METPPQSQGHHLVRRLGPLDATMIVVGSMIGSGIFITSAESSRLTGAPGWLILAWAVAGVMTITGALCCSELAVIVIGLSLGWKADSAARSSDWWNSWRNGWNPQIAQPGLTTVGAFALVLLFGKAMVGPLFAQTAWTNVTFVGSEVRDPGRNLSRALLAGCGLVVILYLLANLAYVATLPLEGIQHAPQNRVAVAAMNAVFGKPGALAMAAAIMISTFGCNNGLILAGARVYYAMEPVPLF